MVPAEITSAPAASCRLTVQTLRPEARSAPAIPKGGQDYITLVTPTSVDPDGSTTNPPALRWLPAVLTLLSQWSQSFIQVR